MSNDWNIPEHRLENYNYIHWKEKKPSVEILDSFDNILVNEGNLPLHPYFFKNHLVQSVEQPALGAEMSRNVGSAWKPRRNERERGRKSRVDGVELMKTLRGGEGLTSVLETGGSREGGIVFTRKVNERGESAP